MSHHLHQHKVWSEAEVISYISKIMNEVTGVQLGERQASMVENRLKKRMLENQVPTLIDYIHYFFAHREVETQALVSLLTTHHTYFFREFSHFEALENNYLKIVAQKARSRGDKCIRIWSAACSRGQEVYSIAMMMDAWLKANAPDLTYKIMGSDIDHESVKMATNGVYFYRELHNVPMRYLQQHWSKGTAEISDYVRVKKTLKDNVQFQVVNLFEIPSTIKTQKFDIIFCRNVFIYFNEEQIKQITTSFLKLLDDSGYLFLGISESLHGMNMAVDTLGPSIYTHHKAKPTLVTPSQAVKVASVPVVNIPKTIRVVCVDDSSSIHMLMKKMLTREAGFEIVGHANNGEEAHKMIQELKPDAVTLDIHMPVMDGISYLKNYHSPRHPAVVMVTSVSRDDASLAMDAFKHGASDFIEKPTLQSLQEKTEELHMKLKSAVVAKAQSQTASLSFDQSFKKGISILHPEQCAAVLIGQFSERKKMESFLKENMNYRLPVIILIDADKGFQETFGHVLSNELSKNVVLLESNREPLKAGQIYLGTVKDDLSNLSKLVKPEKACVMLYGQCSKEAGMKVDGMRQSHILAEDLGEGLKSLNVIRFSDKVPATSFAYMCAQYFNKTEQAK
ncbi:MAG: CheR family methyltransferase [Bacteriovoracaceae bacterium]